MNGFFNKPKTASPYAKALAVYERENCRRSFAEDLRLHLEHGYVLNMPDVFALARPVKCSAPDADIVNPAVNWPVSECNCWHIFLFSGDVVRAVARIPFDLPLFSFERCNKLRFIEAVRLVGYFIGEEKSS